MIIVDSPDASRVVPARTTDVANHRNTTTPRILVADHDPSTRQSVKQRLEQMGYSVVEATDARSVRAAWANAIDLIMLASQLPDTSGMRLLNELRHFDPDTPVVMISEHPNAEYAVQAMKAGASQYVAKPFNLDLVVLTIARALEIAELRKALRDLQNTTVDRSSVRLPANGINIRQLERDLVEQALARTNSNQTRAAALLGMNRDQIRYRMQQYGLLRKRKAS